MKKINFDEMEEKIRDAVREAIEYTYGSNYNLDVLVEKDGNIYTSMPYSGAGYVVPGDSKVLATIRGWEPKDPDDECPKCQNMERGYCDDCVNIFFEEKEYEIESYKGYDDMINEAIKFIEE